MKKLVISLLLSSPFLLFLLFAMESISFELVSSIFIIGFLCAGLVSFFLRCDHCGKKVFIREVDGFPVVPFRLSVFRCPHCKKKL